MASDEAQLEVETGSGDEFRMTLQVNIEETGPCKKHVRVTVPQTDIQHFYAEELNGLVTSANVPGFRAGKVPARLVERRYKDELVSQVKQKVLLESLEQVAEENELDPINEPDLNIEAIEMPLEADFEYEFDVEVRPSFDLPDYGGLSIERPVREISQEDIDAYQREFLSQYGETTKVDRAAAAGDTLVAALEITHGEESLSKSSRVVLEVKPRLRFVDGEYAGFDQIVEGVNVGESRSFDVSVSTESENLAMRGETVTVNLDVNEIRSMELPELDRELLDRIGVETPEQLQEEIRGILDRQMTYQQRQSTRAQVLEKITESADWDLPESLVLRQTDNALRREILEMQQAGFSPAEVDARRNEIRQRAVSTTRQALKEHFVLDKIATNEGLDVSTEEIEMEIQMMAWQSGETPRRLRARMIKSGMIENLEAQIRERKAVDFILDQASFVDVPAEDTSQSDVCAVSVSLSGDRVADSVSEDDGSAEDA